MDIDIDPLSPTPLYQQIRDAIVRGIGRGELHQGDTLASVRSLAGAFGINPATVTKAYGQLRSEGLLESNAKMGSFIARDRTSDAPERVVVDQWHDHLVTLLAEGLAQGLSADTVLQSCQTIVRTMAGDSHGTVNSTADTLAATNEQADRAATASAGQTTDKQTEHHHDMD